MVRLREILNKISLVTEKVSFVICIVFLSTMVIVGLLGVIFRFLLHASLAWNEELDAYLFVWVTMLGASIGYKYRSHPQVLFLVNLFPALLRRIVLLAADIIVAVLGAILIYSGTDMLLKMGVETATSIPISMVYPYAAIPIGGFFLIIHAAAHIINDLSAQNDTAATKEAEEWQHSA